MVFVQGCQYLCTKKIILNVDVFFNFDIMDYFVTKSLTNHFFYRDYSFFHFLHCLSHTRMRVFPKSMRQHTEKPRMTAPNHLRAPSPFASSLEMQFKIYLYNQLKEGQLIYFLSNVPITDNNFCQCQEAPCSLEMTPNHNKYFSQHDAPQFIFFICLSALKRELPVPNSTFPCLMKSK